MLFITDMELTIDKYDELKTSGNDIDYFVNDGKFIAIICIKSACSLILAYFAYYEINQAKKNFREYFSDMWNLFDYLLIIFNGVVTVMFFLAT